MSHSRSAAPDRLSRILTDEQMTAIIRADLRDPFELLGMHPYKKGVSVVAFLPEAAAVRIYGRPGGAEPVEMTRIHPDGIFAAVFEKRKRVFPYEFHISRHDGGGAAIVDPYAFLPVMSEQARYLFNEGNCHRVYDDLGSHVITHQGVKGVVFAVWAPNAKRVSLVGQFNGWDGRRHPMRLLGNSGVWELFVPGLAEGVVYKYEIKKHFQDHLVLKSDPYGYLQEPFPYHGSVVTDLDAFPWTDGEWMARRPAADPLNRPVSIYEVHLGSWCRSGPDEEGDFLTYEQLAEKLAAYVKNMGFTHVELMPVQEHPYVPSWGYQVTGFYAANHRFGSPAGFQHFVDHMHTNGIGVILDWVPGHFPKDAHGLAQFDGTCLYEHADPREGEHKDWGTLIFNYGRHEVRNFLTSNALFWLEKFHLDGLRIDAVASMLYRDYSRKAGEWIPNRYGGRENLEAIEFLQSVNYLVGTKFPGVLTIAEESTAYPMVSRPTYVGGLGFSLKWNMGWMHDILAYFTKDPVFRKHHHNQLTFGLWYAFNENFVLVLSHDEVVHGKHSLLEKMPGDGWQKFANLRALYGYMIGHPGKKHLFMGGEFGMHNEWYSKRSIDWHVLNSDDDAFHHEGLMRMVAGINRLYQNEPALWEADFEHRGFTWIDHGDWQNSVVTFMRHGNEWHNLLVFACNFTPVVRHNYRVGVPYGGFYEEVFNTDAKEFGGAGFGNLGGVHASAAPCHNQPCSIDLTLPPLAVCVFKWRR